MPIWLHFRNCLVLGSGNSRVSWQLMGLHNFISILLATAFLWQTSSGQNNANKLLKIQKIFQKINNDTSLRKRAIDDAQEFLRHATDGGGQLVGYFHKDSICKIFATLGLSYGTITDEYYFNDERLIFVYETEKDFPETDSLGSLDYNKLDLVYEARYYFDNDKVIHKITRERGVLRALRITQQIL